MATRVLTYDNFKYYDDKLKTYINEKISDTESITDKVATITQAVDNVKITLNDRFSPLEYEVKALKNRVNELENELFENQRKEQYGQLKAKSKRKVSVHIKL
jgi:predicted nuclease with TOPRIM domain